MEPPLLEPCASVAEVRPITSVGAPPIAWPEAFPTVQVPLLHHRVPVLFAGGVGRRALYVTWDRGRVLFHAYDPRADDWSTVEGPFVDPGLARPERALVVGPWLVLSWSGDGTRATGWTHPAVRQVAFDSRSLELRDLPPGGPASLADATVVSAGGLLLAWPEDHPDLARWGEGVGLDLDSGRWSGLPSEGAPGTRQSAVVAVVGDRVVVARGATPRRRDASGEVVGGEWLDDGAVLGAEGWRPLPEGGPERWTHGRAGVAGDTRLVVGTTPRRVGVLDLERWVWIAPAGLDPADPAMDWPWRGWSLGDTFVGFLGEGWGALAGDPPAFEALPPAPVHGGWIGPVSDRAFAFRGPAGDLLLLDAATRRWCTIDIGGRLRLPGGEPVLTWSDADGFGVWGQLAPAPGATCPGGTPSCPGRAWTSSAEGVVVRWAE